MPCANVTCDRQHTRCYGCFGRSHTLEPIVLQADVAVKNCVAYNATGIGNRAIFPKFRSLRFTSIFFDNISMLSAKSMMDQRQYDREISKKIKEMVKVVNENGGWTVSGWHRRGLINDADDVLLSTTTIGHLTFLIPSRLSVLEEDVFKSLIIETPGDNEGPQPLAGAQPPTDNAAASSSSTT